MGIGPTGGNRKLTGMLYSGIPELVDQAIQAIEATLCHVHGDVKAAAKKLKVGRSTLNRWIIRFELYPSVLKARGNK
jgi:DNA-binding NtrC family response regulator